VIGVGKKATRPVLLFWTRNERGKGKAPAVHRVAGRRRGKRERMSLKEQKEKTNMWSMALGGGKALYVCRASDLVEYKPEKKERHKRKEKS